MRRTTPNTFLHSAALLLACAYVANAQSLNVVSGNGQVVFEYFQSVSPMTVRAVDASNRPIPGLSINWSITSGQGTLVNTISGTDANGIASTFFLGSAVPGGSSIQQSTVTASSSVGSASFFVTTAILRLPNGAAGAPPLVELRVPTQENPVVVGTAGSVVGGAIQVRVGVQAGPETGRPVPNVGVRVYHYTDPATNPSGECNTPNGIVLTDSTGTATCDLRLNNLIGTNEIAISAGESVITRKISLTVNQGAPCTFTLSPNTQSFPSLGGTGTFNLTPSSPTCTWTAQSNASWILMSSATSGTGSRTLNYTVLNNTGPARDGTIIAGGQTFTVRQAAIGATGVLSIGSPATLPNGTINQPFSYVMQATGGVPPYIWSAGAGLPQGLSLSPGGFLSGIPQTAGIFSFPVSVSDAAGGNFTRLTSVTITNADSSLPPTITTTSLPSGSVGAAYQGSLSFTGGCPSLVSISRFSLVSGQLPPGLTLQQLGDRWVIAGTPTQAGAFLFTLAITDPCGRSSSSNLTLTIGGQQAANSILSSIPQLVSFTVTAGSQVRPGDQLLSIVSAGQPINYVATASTENNQPWIVLGTGSSGTTPGALSVGVANYASFLPGTYRGTITLGGAGIAPALIPVTLTINSAPALTASPFQLTFNSSIVITPTSQRQSIAVSGPIGATYTASASTDNAVNWLGVTPVSGTVPASVEAVVNPLGLTAGVYTGRITLGTAGSTLTVVPVTLTVTSPPIFTWSTTGLTFAVSSSEPVPLPQTLTIATTTGASIPVTVAANTASGGNWLRLTPSAGVTPLSMNITVDTTGLRAGQYNGEIVARSSDGGIAASSIRVILLITENRPVITSIVNAASDKPGPVAPGSWVTIRGAFLGSTQDLTIFKVTDGKVDTTLADARFLVDGIPAPIIQASSQKAVIQIPYSASLKDRVEIVAEYRGIRSDPTFIPIVLISPAIFYTGTPGDSQGRILNENGSQNGVGNQATAGSIIAIHATGEGLTNPAGEDGKIATNTNTPQPLSGPIQVWMDGQEAEFVSATGLVGWPAGIVEIKVKAPSNTRRGVPIPVTLGINGNFSPDLVTAVILGQ